MNQIKRGYTLTVKSWENDGDNRNTKSKTVATKEEAEVWNEMMELCKSQNNQPDGVIKLGNSSDGFDDEQRKVAIDFIKKHHKILLPKKDDIESVDEEVLEDRFCDLAGELLGYGENYSCRVMESCVVTYSDVDVIPKVVKL